MMMDIDGRLKIELNTTQIGYLLAAIRIAAGQIFGPKAELTQRELIEVRDDIVEQVDEQLAASTMARQIGLEEHRPMAPEPSNPEWKRLDVNSVIESARAKRLG